MVVLMKLEPGTVFNQDHCRAPALVFFFFSVKESSGIKERFYASIIDLGQKISI